MNANIYIEDVRLVIQLCKIVREIKIGMFRACKILCTNSLLSVKII